MNSPKQKLPHPVSIAVLALGAGLAGCTSSSSGGGSGVIFESEFNGDAASADFIGYVAPGDHYVIGGDIGFGSDAYDGFAFIADHPGEVEFVLTAHDPFAALAVYVWDPVLNAFIYTFDSGFNPEIGSFDVFVFGAEFHLVVVPLFGAADYTLTVDGHPLFAAPSAESSDGSAPNRFGSDAPAPNASELERLRGYAPAPAARPLAAAEPVTFPAGELLVFDAEGNLARHPITAVVD